MRIEIDSRDGAGRIGKVRINNRNFRIPNIIFIDVDRAKCPDFAEFIGTYDEKGEERNRIIIRYPRSIWLENGGKENTSLSLPKGIIYPPSMPAEFHSNIENQNWGIISCNEESKIFPPTIKGKIFTLANLISLYPRSRVFVENIVKAREKVGYSSLLHASGIADVKNISLLVYMGIDLFDSLKAIVCARRGFLFFPEGNIHKDNLMNKICYCDSCRRFDDPRDMDFDDILLHNLIALKEEMNRIRFFISKGCLRELVESRVSNSPELLEKFRILNEEFYEFLEERTPIIKKVQLKATLRESLNYPEIERFRRRIIERYKKPKSAKILLLLPCSAKKPYSLSKSHRMFREVIAKSGNPYVIHEVVITSPLGIVPRELEMIYPASSYDIPVTGHWFEDELEMIRRMLKMYKEKNVYDVVVSHLPNELNSIIGDVFGEVISTCNGNPTSKNSLTNLKNILSETVSNYKRMSRSKRLLDDLRSIASYQFGEDVAKELIREDYQLKGVYPNLKVFKGDKQVCSLSKERGLLSLTLEGAEVLLSKNMNLVRIEKDLEIRGSVLAPCVEYADDRIRIEDEVIVMRENEMYAVGIAKMNGKEMVELSYGEAVKIRHHI